MAISETKESGWRTSEKWGVEAASAGFTVVPNHLLAVNQFVDDDRKLSSTELMVLLQLVGAWWSADRPPFPSKTTLAQRTGLSARQIQRAIQALEKKGFLARISRFIGTRGRTSNAYDLQGTVDLVQEIAKKFPKAFKRDVVASVPRSE